MDKTVPAGFVDRRGSRITERAERVAEGGGRKWIEKVGKVAAQHVS